MTRMFIDTHTHIISPADGVDKIILVGTDLDDSQKAILIAQQHENVFATVGIHPQNTCSDWERFEELVKQPKVVGIGECGLDYHQNYDPAQKQIFEKQLEIARKYDLPLSIHIRDAWEETKGILDSARMTRGVLHCYSGPPEIPKNFYVSFAGNVTFNNAKELQELAKNIPLEKILLETDSPYLAPEPVRGTQNFPENVKIIAQFLAKLKNVRLEEVAKITTENANKLFNF